MSLCARVRGLSVRAGEAVLLDDVSLDCPDGGITVLVGRSGSGKTTLLRSLNRLNDHFPSLKVSGTVEVKLGGVLKDVYAPDVDAAELRRRVGMVFQSPNPLPLSAARNILLPLSLTLGVRGAEAQDVMESVLRQVGLWDEISDRLSVPAESLSGGQQQRLCLARMLALRPDVLLLDEPTASLDRRAAELVEDLLLSLKNRYPVIMVSHSLAQAQKLASRLAVMRAGKVFRVLDREEIPDGAAGQVFIEGLL